jgi:hypothetical protein
MQNQKVMVDPSAGWRYGFPRAYDPAVDGSMPDWLVRCGYPLEHLDFALSYLRVWGVE